MEGVAWACAFLRRADALNGTGAEHAQAMYRNNASQAQLLPERLAMAAARPELVSGANAILTEYLCCGGESGAGMMNVGAFAEKAYEALVALLAKPLATASPPTRPGGVRRPRGLTGGFESMQGQAT